MDVDASWACVALTLVVMVLYEGLLLLPLRRRDPLRFAPARHAGLREEWFRAVSEQPGSEVLAVQTLRNSLMSATMLASTAALALMGAATLAAPSLRDGLAGLGAAGGPGPRLLLELVLLALLSASLLSTLMAVRLYNHAGFVGGMPVASPARARWTAAGARYVSRAGLLYGFGLRQLVLVGPVVAALLLPAAGPVAGLLVVVALYALDRFGHEDGPG